MKTISGIITYSPLGAGFLTGKHLNGVQKNSRFDIMPAHQDVYSGKKAQRRLNKLMQVAKATGHTPALLAMAWALHQPQTDSVLIGGRSTSQLDLATEAIKFYTPDIFSELERD
jgi:aryl-alcohol dehydrogenase-like predicted oxidoreductase